MPGLALLAMATLLPAALQPIPAQASVNYTLSLVASGLNQPVYMAGPPGDYQRYFIVEKGGVIRVFASGRLLQTPFLNISSRVSTDGERGLLSMAFDPGYRVNRRYYVYYTDKSTNIVVSWFTTSANDPNRSNTIEHPLVRIPHPTYNNHNGGQLQIDPIAAKRGQDMLYFGTGDGGSAGDPNNNAQNKNSGLGKLFRMDVHAPRPVKQLFAYGLRNPWRFSFDRLNGDLRIGDVGQDSWEELDFVKSGGVPGLNFGWRKYEGRHLYHDQSIDASRLTWPFAEYSNAGGNCAVVGGYMYRGSISSLYGSYLFADLCTGNIWMRRPGHNAVLMNISGQVSNIVSFAEGNLGGIFVISIDGSIYRLGA